MKYIIGGGLAGLVTAYNNPEYTVLTPETSGFVETRIGRAFVVIHEDERTLELFRDLEVPSFVKEIRLAYYYPGIGVVRDVKGTRAEPVFTKRYLERKLPADMQPSSDAELGGAPGSQFRALYIDEDLIARLSDEVDVEYGKVTEIGPDTLEFEGEIREWDRIVSTIPANIFRRLVPVDLDWDLNHHVMTYGEIESVPQRYLDIPWDYLYVVDDVPYHRVISHVVSSRYFVECFGRVNLEATVAHEVYEQFHHDTGVIQPEEIEPPYDGMTFVGRFAKWDPDILTNDVIGRQV